MSNYNEAWESEKRTLSLLVETSFYQTATPDIPNPAPVDKVLPIVNSTVADKAAAFDSLLSNPVLAQQIMQLLLSGAVNA